MKSVIFFTILLLVALSGASAFTPMKTSNSMSASRTFNGRQESGVVSLNMAVFDDGERKSLTRESEPDEYFQT